MKTKNYNTDNLKDRKLFYMLDNITDDSLKLFRRTPAGDEEFTAYDLHRMPDGKLLIAFWLYWDFQTVHSLVAICGDEEEYVSLLPFERIVPYWNPSLDYSNRGIFLFMNSKPIYTDVNSWRCDNTFYGVERYLTEGEKPYYDVFELDDIIVYEPIININGVSSLVYTYLKRVELIKDHWINGDPIPGCTATLSEMFRLVTEWATLADAPFSSTDPISLDAKEFLNQIGFDNSLVADQVDMQVAEYLKGNTDARRRPSGVVETNQELLNFVKQKMAHMSLAGLMSCYSEYGNLDAEIQMDIESANNEFFQTLSNMQIQGNHSLDSYEDALELIPSNHVNGKQAYSFRWKILKQKKDIALSFMS